MTKTQQENITKIALAPGDKNQALALRLLIGAGMTEKEAWRKLLEIVVFREMIDGGYYLGVVDNFKPHYDQYELVRLFNYLLNLYYKFTSKKFKLDRLDRRPGGVYFFSFLEIIDISYNTNGDDTAIEPMWIEITYKKQR